MLLTHFCRFLNHRLEEELVSLLLFYVLLAYIVANVVFTARMKLTYMDFNDPALKFQELYPCEQQLFLRNVDFHVDTEFSFFCQIWLFFRTLFGFFSVVVSGNPVHCVVTDLQAAEENRRYR